MANSLAAESYSMVYSRLCTHSLMRNGLLHVHRKLLKIDANLLGPLLSECSDKLRCVIANTDLAVFSIKVDRRW